MLSRTPADSHNVIDCLSVTYRNKTEKTQVGVSRDVKRYRYSPSERVVDSLHKLEVVHLTTSMRRGHILGRKPELMELPTKLEALHIVDNVH